MVFRHRRRATCRRDFGAQLRKSSVDAARRHRFRAGDRRLRRHARGRDRTAPGSPPTCVAAYVELHRLGHAHSVEVFDGERAGRRHLWRRGRPDVLRRKHVQRGNPAVRRWRWPALPACLRGWGWPLIDAQVENPHLRLAGRATTGRASEFLAEVAGAGRRCPEPARFLDAQRFGRLARQLASASRLALTKFLLGSRGLWHRMSRLHVRPGPTSAASQEACPKTIHRIRRHGPRNPARTPCSG